jgi:YbbR domain-containing protein
MKWPEIVMRQLNKNKNNFSKILKKIFFENIKIKIICFILAIITYLLVGYFQRSEKIFYTKLNIIDLKETLTISNELPSSIKITIRDKNKVLEKISESDFNVRLDLSNIEKNTDNEMKLKYDIPKEMQSFFSSIKLEPDSLKVSIEKLSEKNVPIIANSTGNLESGYVITRTIIDPSEVRIQGPERLLSKIKFIETEKININEEKESFIREVNLISPHHLVKIIGKEKIEISFEIEKE